MKVYAQDSLDGKEWRPLSLAGEPLVFEAKYAAKEWWEHVIYESNSIDWRVGYVVRFRDGKFFRLVDRKGQEIKFT